VAEAKTQTADAAVALTAEPEAAATQAVDVAVAPAVEAEAAGADAPDALREPGRLQRRELRVPMGGAGLGVHVSAHPLGCHIDSIDADGFCARNGFVVGDVLVACNDHPLRSVEMLERAAMAGSRLSVLFYPPAAAAARLGREAAPRRRCFSCSDTTKLVLLMGLMVASRLGEQWLARQMAVQEARSRLMPAPLTGEALVSARSELSARLAKLDASGLGDGSFKVLRGLREKVESMEPQMALQVVQSMEAALKAQANRKPAGQAATLHSLAPPAGAKVGPTVGAPMAGPSSATASPPQKREVKMGVPLANGGTGAPPGGPKGGTAGGAVGGASVHAAAQEFSQHNVGVTGRVVDDADADDEF
jgi:hypothetical protein